MSMRMVPLKATFQKMTRVVRDVSQKVGKEVTLTTPTCGATIMLAMCLSCRHAKNSPTSKASVSRS